MTNLHDRLTAQWQDVANLTLGLWLAASPWTLGYANEATAAWNAHAVGLVIAMLALAALWSCRRWQQWVNAALGLWLIISPSMLGFLPLHAAIWNQFFVGLPVAILAFWSGARIRDTGAIEART